MPAATAICVLSSLVLVSRNVQMAALTFHDGASPDEQYSADLPSVLS